MNLEVHCLSTEKPEALQLPVSQGPKFKRVRRKRGKETESKLNLGFFF